MAKTEKSTIDIGKYIKSMYTNPSIETKEAQPIFMLHRDTIKTFIHEKRQYCGIEGKLLGLIGVEITIVTSLLTATFNDWIGIKGNLIKGIFFAFGIILAFLIGKEFIIWLKHRKSCTVDALVEELGSRGSIIKSNPEKGLDVDHNHQK